MAFVVRGWDIKSKDKVYNVEKPVGSNGVNSPGDVKLVQYMLRHIYGNAASDLAVDGFIGPVTLSWIKRFQQDAKAGGNNILADGRIDRAFGQVSSISKTVYTIVIMNLTLRKRNPSAFAALPQHVSLNPNPVANPYNPVKKKVQMVIIFDFESPKRVELWYDDGSKEVAYVSGDVVIDGKKFA